MSKMHQGFKPIESICVRSTQNTGCSKAKMRHVAAPQVVSVSSGKGGVGKTSLVVNLAVAWAKEGLRVLVMDGDLGLANVDIALGVSPLCSIQDVLCQDASIEEALFCVRRDLYLLPAAAGRFELANLAVADQARLWRALASVASRFDVILVDTGAGIGATAMGMASWADHAVVLSDGEPTALSDAYGWIKTIRAQHAVKRVQLVATRVSSAAEGEAVFARLSDLSGRFLDLELSYLGHVVADRFATRALRAGVPLLEMRPEAPAAVCIQSIAKRLVGAATERVHPSQASVMRWSDLGAQP